MNDIDHDIAGQNVLVTGGAGFIGSHIADALVADNDVTVLDDLSSGDRANVPEGATLRVGDVTDDADRASAMADADVVFHEAAVVSVSHSVDAPVETNRTNADATLALLEDARREDARVVIASSAAVYGHPEYVPIPEDHPTEPTSPYGISKLTADQYVRLYAELYDLPTVALRYFNAYGPRQAGGDYSAVISTFVEQALAGDPITVNGDGGQTRDFVHVEDIVRANLRAATTDAVGEAYNVGTGDTVRIDELAELIRTAADSDSPIRNVDGRPGDIRHSRADTTAARERLGFEATVALGDGLPTVPGL
ncbi:NAD-dependent epimerase/dehydratase family protein [Halapricum sp. CBA1109]|uniref:NAD-dependent epimerase/dehydratase family protein n=1 Tax=Halapricum sp. CBA1109 TaxID=2668068 RepID=UPI0012F934C2|nr:NAD-dependent epimerase/dehydratase family protein [Halapricum sp. CBA1109]MUV88620.1 NAD-dependent epimerase/dehydratase family protein [Halapricum sp. CBA1109]